jgi:hypothetical protein
MALHLLHASPAAAIVFYDSEDLLFRLTFETKLHVSSVQRLEANAR